VLGVLNLEGKVGELRSSDLRLLTMLAAPIAVAIENAHLVARLTAQATRDPLTGLLNRRGILAALDAALARATPLAPLSVLLVDLNGFKAVNDRHGHAVGDRLLAALAELLATNARAGDPVGRLGGDEFLVVLPHADGGHAGAVVRQLAAALADEATLPSGVGYSLGLATATTSEAAVALLARADRALYEAKRHGDGAVRFLHSEENV
jgi:diguanylate cyclase (GGDEF)-like protein